MLISYESTAFNSSKKGNNLSDLMKPKVQSSFSAIYEQIIEILVKYRGVI